MELKNYFAQDSQGNILGGATCYLYEPDTENVVGGLETAGGDPLANPFSAAQNGLIQFRAPSGEYDLRVVSGVRDYRVRVQCLDVLEQIAVASGQADRAESEADRAAAQADEAAAAKGAAENARDAAMVAGNIYPDTAAGLTAGVPYFSVPSADSAEYLLLYRNNAGVAQLLKRYPSDQAVRPLRYGDSVRFPRENGEDHTSSENGLLYLPNSNNLFKTSANYDTPWAVAAGTLAVAVSVPHNFYAGMNRKAIIIGVMNGLTTSGDLRVEYLPRGATSPAAGDKHRFRVTLWPYGTATDKRLQALSPVLPETFQRGVIFARVIGGALQVDVVETDNPTVLQAGTPVALPAGWTGVARLNKNLCIGGTDADAFPQSYSTVYGRQNLALWKGEIGFLGLADTSLSDAECLSIAAGASMPTVAGAGNMRLHCLLAASGVLSTAITSNKAAVVDSLAVLGTLRPGSTLRRQSSAQYLTIDAIKDGQFAAVLSGHLGSEVKITGQFAGVSGHIELQLLDSAGAVVRDWFNVGAVPASGSTWEAWVSLPLHAHALHLAARATSAPTVIARSNTDLLCGYAVLFQGQSQVVFGTMSNSTYTGGDDSLGLKPRDWGGTVLFAAHGGDYSFPRCYRAELSPAYVGSGFITIANYLRARTPYPLLLVSLAKSGTALSDLVNDDLTGRQWVDDRNVFSLLAARNRAGQYRYTAQVMNWGSTDTYNDYWEQVLTPYLLGRGSTQIPKANIDHWLYDGSDFDPAMKFVVVPFSRSTGTAGTYDTDGSAEAIRRKSMRDGAASLGYLLGPEATVYSIDGSTDAGTHPSKTDATYGIPLYSKSLAEAAALGCGFGTWRGVTKVDSAGVKFTDTNRNAFLVGFSGPLGGGLYTLGGGAGVTSFEVSTDGGTTWSKSGFTATIEDGMACRITKDSGAYPSGTTRVRCYSGSPGHYGVGYFPTWIAGALFKDGFPVSGGNDAYSVADA